MEEAAMAEVAAAGTSPEKPQACSTDRVQEGMSSQVSVSGLPLPCLVPSGLQRPPLLPTGLTRDTLSWQLSNNEPESIRHGENACGNTES